MRVRQYKHIDLHHHHILLLAAAECDFGVTLASGHAVLHHRKRGLAVLLAKGAGRAKIEVRTRTNTPAEGKDCTMHKDACYSTGRRRLCSRSPGDRTRLLRSASCGEACCVNFQRGRALRISLLRRLLTGRRERTHGQAR